ncbi:MAG: hypothetical protein V3V08_09315 [Nannocystaceae bacterium]
MVMRSRVGNFCLVALLLVALAEIVAAASAYRSTISPDDWSAVSERLDRGAPLLLATRWLEPAARHHLDIAREDDSVAPHDLYGMNRFHVLAPRGAEGWSHQLDIERGALPLPDLLSRETLGGLALYTYDQPDSPTLLDDLLSAQVDVSARFDDRELRCRHRRNRWNCARSRLDLGSLSIRTVEVNYRPRRCMTLDARDGTHIEIRLPDMTLGDFLRGHVGFSDFNARLRSEAPIAVSITVRDTLLMRRVFSDSEGWSAFEIHTEPGRGPVTIGIDIAVQGTWSRRGHRSNPPLRPCIELRSFEANTP